MSIHILFEAIITGFILSIMIGPVFFLLLETSIKMGIRAGIAFDVGVLLSDAIYIMIAYVFYAKVEDMAEGDSSFWFRVIGGVLFLAYGFYTLFFKKNKDVAIGDDGKIVQEQEDYRLLLLKGFVLNFANPLVIFYWFSVMTLAAQSAETENMHVMSYLAAIMASFFCFDILKIIGAKRLRPLVTQNVLKALNRFIGIVFVGFGLFLAIQGALEKM